MIRLHVNIDHVATLRNARGSKYPDPIYAAHVCEHAGADGITAHLREDRRHIRDDDLVRLRAAVTTLLNMELAVTDEMLAIAEQVRPDVITLVPERREERTTEGGLDVVAGRAAVERARAMTLRAGIKLSLFVEPAEAQLRAAYELGADQVELHTGEYALAATPGERQTQLDRLAAGAELAASLGLEVAAGHGLTTFNTPDIAAIEHIEELNIGHAIMSDALFLGLDAAVDRMRQAIDRGLARRPL